MDKNMEKLLNKLELEEDIRSYFSNAKLSKILCNKVDNKYCFVIDIDKILPVDIYDNFMAKLTDAYSEYNGVIASFKVSDIDNTLINEYYKYILSKYSNVFMLIDLFSNNKLDYTDGVLSIDVDSKAEKAKLETIVPTLEKELLHIGFGKIKVNVLINEENKKKIEEEIQKSLDIKLEPLPETVEVEKKRPPMMKRKKTEDGCILGRHIEGHVESISNIIDEDSNVIIEATVFDMEVIETRSGFKIATLKLTDYTDSIYAKMFAKEDSEYERILKVKKGKWYRLRGYIQNDD
jgi:DNA polymerase-3 subunit alpha (Gram-positive type)